MSDVFVGLLAVGVGALFLFRGYLALRVVFPIWGAFVGFLFGASLIAGFTGDGYLATATSWVVGLVFGLIFAVLAYLYYAVSVVIGMASIGFVLGTALMAVLGVQWSWLVVLVGLVVGVALAYLAIATNLPMVLLVVLSALAGASMVITGLLLLVGKVDTGQFDSVATTARIDLGWGWTALAIVLVIAGIASQATAAGRLRQPMRDAWGQPVAR